MNGDGIGQKNLELALARKTEVAIDGGLASGGGNTTVDDASKSWTANAWAGGIIQVIKSDGKEYFRVISANTDTQITFAALPGGVVVAAGDIYSIKRVSDPKVDWLQGLDYHGIVTAVPGANQFTIPTLAGLGDAKFADVTAPYRAFVMRDAGGAGAAPQGEMQTVTAYVSATGTFTTTGFTIPVAIGDEILILHPRLAEVLTILTNIGDPSAHALKSLTAKLGNNATDFNTRIGNPDGDTLKSLVAKWGNIARSLTLILGARWNAAGDLGTDIAAILASVGGGGGSPPPPGPTLLDMVSRPRVEVYEGWQDEAGLDPGVWSWTDPATGGAWARGGDGPDLMASAAPNANENAQLVSNQRWTAGPTQYGTNKILRRLTLEFELQMAGVANLNNGSFFLGLTRNSGDTRVADNLIGFGLVGVGNALQTVTDNGGAETTNTGFGENLANKNKLKIDVYLNTVDFYLNETKIASHVTNLPNYPMYINFWVPTGAGGAATIKLGIIRAWVEDIAR